jgi:hypothetical protein
LCLSEHGEMTEGDSGNRNGWVRAPLNLTESERT